MHKDRLVVPQGHMGQCSLPNFLLPHTSQLKDGERKADALQAHSLPPVEEWSGGSSSATSFTITSQLRDGEDTKAPQPPFLPKLRAN